jgi:serine/threonine protein kinase
MGTLYLASDPSLDRKVAIKVLRDDDPGLRERFAREGKAAARLRHRNIPAVYEVGEFEGQPYLAMEYIEGETLWTIIRNRTALPLGERLRIVEELCEGLAVAHRAGIIHRDIKPANVMLDAEGVVKILDFGIARSLQHGDATVSSLTRQGDLVGTLNYMAPEQLSGAPADQRSDIFAVGAVLYELLTFRQAFAAETPASVLFNILNREPTAVTELNPAVDDQVASLVSRALAKDPQRRYQTAEELRVDLEAVRTGADADVARAATVHELSTVVMRRRWPQRWTVMITAAVAAIVAATWVVQPPGSEVPAASPLSSAPPAVQEQSSASASAPQGIGDSNLTPPAAPAVPPRKPAGDASPPTRPNSANDGSLPPVVDRRTADPPPDSGRVAAAVSQGAAAFASGNLQEAIRAWTGALVLSPADSELGDALRGAIAKTRLQTAAARQEAVTAHAATRATLQFEAAETRFRQSESRSASSLNPDLLAALEGIAEAGVLYRLALAAVTEQSRTATESPSAGQPDERQVIVGVLEEYRRALEAMDIPAIRKIYPAVDQAALERAFRNYQAHAVEFQITSVAVTGDVAVVRCNVITRIRSRQVGDRTEPSTAEFHMVRRERRWFISERR